MTYFFILGNNPTLSIAEIINVLSGTTSRIKQTSSKVLILESKREINVESLQKQLGGTIKIGEVVCSIDLTLRSDLVNRILKLLPQGFKKVYFGFSFYNLGSTKKDKGFQKKREQRIIRDIALEIKKELKEKSIASRWVNSSKQILSSVIVRKNKLLNQGIEIVFLIDGDKFFLGKTLTCQDFEQYSWRDFGRPARSIKNGMIPPKLGQIMVNLSLEHGFPLKKEVFLDPFCGSGTILQEALLIGYENIIGTDKDKKAIINTQKNLEWLAVRFRKSLSLDRVKIFQSDISEVSKKIKPRSIETIVTEPYLGPLRFKISDFRFMIKRLSQLYILAFKEFKKILKSDKRVVIIFPVFSAQGGSASGGKKGLQFLPILEQIIEMGWQIKSPIPQFLLKNPEIRVTNRNSIIYSRPDQRILREIFIFKSNK